MVVIIEVNPAPERPKGHPPLTVEWIEHLGQDFRKRHVRPSITRRPLPLWRCMKPGWTWGGPSSLGGVRVG
jgi:hypothetical protein